ncbi:MAG: class I SAM-dependent methyltransferase [Flammeovirgaceae bacterium]
MKDLFSSHSAQYHTFRPSYPPELFEFIYGHVRHFDAAWDCATGSGQAAFALAKKFSRVCATDISQSQLSHAAPAHNIDYSTAAAEHTKFADRSFDLIAVAQAAHWVNHDLFYYEARRVGKEGAMRALWGYGLLQTSAKIDGHIQEFYTKVVGPFWDTERKHIDAHYRTLPFPFEEVDSPPFTFSLLWTIDQLQGYLSTWSAVHKFKSANGYDPVPALIGKVRGLWHEPTQTITFPLFLRLGKL